MGKVADYINTLPYLDLSKSLTWTERFRERELATELREELIQERQTRLLPKNFQPADK